MPLTTAEDVAAMLRWSAPEVTKYAPQLEGFIAAATEVIEREAGPVEARAGVWVADGGERVTLPHRVSSVDAVTVDGEPFTDYTADLNAGVLHGPFTVGTQNVVVEYTTGFDEVPATVKFAATSLVVHMWNVASQRGSGLPEDYSAAPVGFLVPNVVKEALAPYSRMPGFA